MVLPTDKHQAFIRKLTDFQQETIHKALRSIRRECKKQGIEIDHILTDNGSEFLDEKTIGGIFGAKVYYTHAYAGWETGTVENLNKLVRRFYPKGTDFSKVTRKQIKALQEKLTAYPRQLKPRKEPKMRIFSVWPVVCVILLAFFRADVKGIAYTRCFDLPLAPWQRVNQITPQSPHKAINAILLRRKCEKTLKRLYSTQESQRLMGRGDSGLRPMRTLPLRCTSL